MEREGLLNALKDVITTIPSKRVREWCGNPSNKTWADWRSRAGVKPMERDLTRLQVYFLICLKNWEDIRLPMGIYDRRLPTIEQMAWFGEICLPWFQEYVITHQEILNGMGLLPGGEDIKGSDLKDIIGDWLILSGQAKKRISEDTVRNRCLAILGRYGRNMKVTGEMLSKLKEKWFTYNQLEKTYSGRS